ncbi:hypothetical protein [Tautonia marina]|uniref:hypothetical protein n=1 Tax=Tautonia marina TaxID=2653855 RepID=UPI001260B8EE|nr:hypothetical protein [Tautonia marina]
MLIFLSLVLATLPGLAGVGEGNPQADAGLRLTSPDQDQHWRVGSKHWITWEPRELPESSRGNLIFSADDGDTWEPVDQVDWESGEYLWTVPDRESNSCLLRLEVEGESPRSISSSRFAVLPSREVPSYRWIKVTDSAPFAARDGAGALVFQGSMWLIGGWNPGDKTHFPRICNNEVWSSEDGAHWVLEKPNTFLDQSFDPTSDWEGRHTAGYAVLNDMMWIIGGDVNQGHYQHDVWNSKDGRTWNSVNEQQPVPWGPRALHYTLVFQDRIWVMGGQTMPGFAPSEEVFYGDLWSSGDGVNWEQVIPEQPSWAPRGMIGGAAVHRDRMWILGGGTYDTPQTPTRIYYNDVWSSADGNRWTLHTSRAPWAARQYHEVASFDGRLWVMEGFSGANRNDVWYSEDGVNWYEIPETPWAPRHAASVFLFDDALWVVAGNNMQPDVWKLVREESDSSAPSSER